MTAGYERPSARQGALRLHLNENTWGCSPLVMEALQKLGPEDAAFYPDYTAVNRESAAYFGVETESLLLTNGLDEGILAACVAGLAFESPWERLFRPARTPYRASLVPEPAFDMYGVSTRAVGGRVVAVPPLADFEFPVDNVIASLTDQTRLVFLTTPNNPTGLAIPRAALDRMLATTAGRAIVFVDEAYADFGRETLIRDIHRYPHLIVGRTFAKAFGLAGLRAGAIIAKPELLAPLRQIVPPYSLNAFAAVAVRAALADVDYRRWYEQQVFESKELLYELCDRLRLKYWRSAANFVLVRVGDRAADIVSRLAARGIAIRNRSSEPGCAGCVRITTGVLSHTAAAVRALEEVLCDAA